MSSKDSNIAEDLKKMDPTEENLKIIGEKLAELVGDDTKEKNAFADPPAKRDNSKVGEKKVASKKFQEGVKEEAFEEVVDSKPKPEADSSLRPGTEPSALFQSPGKKDNKKSQVPRKVGYFEHWG